MNNQIIMVSQTQTRIGQLPSIPCNQTGRTEYLCIPCAVIHADFKERAPRYDVMGDSYIPVNKAWINGRSYTLQGHPDRTKKCGQCGNETMSVYGPEE